MPASEGRGPVQASYKQVDKVFEIDEVSGAGTVVKCMGRTFSAVAADGEVTITDVTDITRPVRLGVARGRDADGRWRIIGPNGQDIVTTASLLHAATTLRQAVGSAFTASAGRGQ
ncbi:hypothetical protein Caci_2743 [Catenulispora acidiphila DSM 44928]|uniref:Uncharacterized protein n=1 Tax=Catenulispora acidiphila (strain DSM 44928 / JCM 14897 / NBRC 102108 / NRRL B-24433 / ID139908) TaxID=479433 RepID=C7PZJ9_CATAD|nr:hypothetical protein [Catenulispora acidiphila]ACU71656.1 hypothetical protein Caci_2743 [Catenulispora acidiphila DSM 44928]